MSCAQAVLVSAADHRRLQAIVADPKTPQKHVWRSRIVLLTADGASFMDFVRERVTAYPDLSAARLTREIVNSAMSEPTLR